MPGTVPPVANEREGLLAFLAQQRDGLKTTAYGLTDEQARMASTAGSLTIGGLVKHVTAVEKNWMGMVLQQERASREDSEASYDDNFRLLPSETLVEVLARYDEAARETEAIVAGIADLGQAVPVPKGVPWFPDDIEAWSVRWVLLHLIQETARHGGHADIVRESIDGATFYPLLAAVESWPETDWLKPWKPTGA